jgi:hypothetical protein
MVSADNWKNVVVHATLNFDIKFTLSHGPGSMPLGAFLFDLLSLGNCMKQLPGCCILKQH